MVSFGVKFGLTHKGGSPATTEAYIHHALHSGDNGRVVGYDNQHGYHHRHYFGAVESVKFTSFEDIETQFQTDWISLRSAP